MPRLLPTLGAPGCLADSDLCLLCTLVSSRAPGSCYFLAQNRPPLTNPAAPFSVSWFPSAWGANCFPFFNSAHFLLPVSFCPQFPISLEETCDSDSSPVMSGSRLPGSAEVTFGISWLLARNPSSSQHLFKHRASGGNALCLLTFLSFGSKFQRGLYCHSAQSRRPVVGGKASLRHSLSVWRCQSFKGWHLGKCPGFPLHVEKDTACRLAFGALLHAGSGCLQAFLRPRLLSFVQHPGLLTSA